MELQNKTISTQTETEEEEKMDEQNTRDKSKASISTIKLSMCPGGPELKEPMLPKRKKQMDLESLLENTADAIKILTETPHRW